MLKVGDSVKVHGKLMGVVTSLHNGGKKVGFMLDDGKRSFTKSSNLSVVTS